MRLGAMAVEDKHAGKVETTADNEEKAALRNLSKSVKCGEAERVRAILLTSSDRRAG
jgi:hypothetical protein